MSIDLTKVRCSNKSQCTAGQRACGDYCLYSIAVKHDQSAAIMTGRFLLAVLSRHILDCITGALDMARFLDNGAKGAGQRRIQHLL
jgi:hypothetical protein